MPSTTTDRLFGLTTSVAVKAPCRTVATSNITLSGLQTLTGVTVVENDRVLVIGQNTGSENGIYIASTGDWVRAADFDGNRDVVRGTLVPVAGNGTSVDLYEVTTANPITIGTTSITFTLRYGANTQYDRSAGEIAAGVTPPNQEYHWSDVRRFGAVGDGTTDSTTALINAIASMEAGGALEFEPAGVYMVRPNNAHTLLFSSKTNFHIRGNNATIKVFDGEAVGADDEIMFFTGCTDGTIENLVVDANRANRTPAEITAHSIDIRTNCARLLFRKVRSINAVVDCWIIHTSTEAVEASYPTDITLEDCEGINGYRQGLSIAAAIRPRVKGGRYSGTNGTAPQSGIDVEPNSTTTFGTRDLLIEDVDVSDNSGYGILVTVSGGAPPTNTRPVLRNIRGINNAQGLINVSVADSPVIDGVQCGVHATLTLAAVQFGNGTVVNPTARNLNFSGITESTANRVALLVHSSVTGRAHIDGVRGYALSCQLMSIQADATVLNVDGRNVTASDVVTVAGGVVAMRNLFVDNCSGRAFYASVPVDLDGATLIDAASTLASAQFDTGSAGAIVKNVTVRQRSSIPVGAVGVYFNVIPRLVQNVTAVSAGTDYNATTIFTFNAGFGGATIEGCSPNPVMSSGAAATISDGGTIAHGLPGTPTTVVATASVASEFASVTARSTSTFTVAIKKHDNSAGTAQTIYWRAERSS